MSIELLVIDTGFQARNSDLQDKKSNWTALFRIVPASDHQSRVQSRNEIFVHPEIMDWNPEMV